MQIEVEIVSLALQPKLYKKNFKGLPLTKNQTEFLKKGTRN